MSGPRSPLPPRLRGVFTSAAAAEAGVGRRRLRHPDVQRVFPGVFLALERLSAAPALLDPLADPLHIQERRRRWLLWQAHAYAKIMRPQEFFCGRTAAVLLGLPIFLGENPRVEVASYAPHPARRLKNVRSCVHLPGSVTLRTVRGLPVASYTSTWILLAADLTLPELVALGDAIVYRDRLPATGKLLRPPHATIAELARETELCVRAGVRAARQALKLISPHSASPPETHLRLRLLEWQLPSPVLDYDVYSPSGSFLGCSEIAYPDYRVAFEYEGDHHRTSPSQWNRDIEKVREYTAAGWITVRVTAQLLYRQTSKLRDIARATLQSRGWNPPKSG